MTAALILAAISGCGSSTRSANGAAVAAPAADRPQRLSPALAGQVIARVGGTSITRGQLELAAPLEAMRASGKRTSSTVPSALTLDRRATLSALIRDVWIYEEAAKRGLRRDEKTVSGEIAEEGVRPSVQAALGVPAAEERYLVGAEVLTQEIFRTLPADERVFRAGAGNETPRMANALDNENARFYNAMTRRWPAKSHCAPAWVVPNCGAYSGESLP
ncbi:MAG: SurA N-terminal domain-containing protein [Solirubrobacteraceae bacterium]